MENSLSNDSLYKIKSALFGLAVGDALGVPAEFKSRNYLAANPVKTMQGYGSWNQQPGTWSDDSSLAFCLAESLTKGYDLNDIATNFMKWLGKGYWGAHHTVFDVGGATRHAIGRLNTGVSPSVSGGIMEADNGNGSLMRILPLVFYINNLPVEERFVKIKEVSSITHAHFRSVFACFIYMETALHLLTGIAFTDALSRALQTAKAFAETNHINQTELNLFKRLLNGTIEKEKASAIHSGGYVLHTLEAAVWCLFQTNNYSDAVLKAVNLGEDTDTTACVTGGLAGLLYGYDDIPYSWLDQLARKDDIHDLCERLDRKLNSRNISMKAGD